MNATWPPKIGAFSVTDTTTDNAADLLYGVGAIATFLGVKKRAAYHLVETNRIPHFKVGKTVCARRSKLMAALEELEAAGA
jgi:excisionase family DNA binding protein